MLNDCSSYPSVSKYDSSEECLKKIEDDYLVAGRLGRGAYGAVLHVTKQGFTEDLAIKILKLSGDNSINEVKMGCMLNTIKDYTPAFAYTFGWITCSSLPKRWEAFLNINPNEVTRAIKNGEPLLYIVMEYIKYTWKDDGFALSIDKMIPIMFLMYHGLYIARKHLKIIHQDLFNSNNIMLTPADKDATFQIYVGKFQYTLKNLYFIPKFIDFGQATDVYDDDDYISDLEHIQEAFIDKLHSNKQDTSKFREFFNTNLYKTAMTNHQYEHIENLLLYSKIFEHPDIVKSENPRVEAKCTFCGSNATRKWENTDIKFCKNICYHRFKSVGSLIIN